MWYYQTYETVQNTKTTKRTAMQMLSRILDKIKNPTRPRSGFNPNIYTVDKIEGIIKENDELKDQNEQLSKEKEQLSEENKKLRQELEKLQTGNKALNKRLKMTSQNSSKPPSTDGYKKKITNNRRKSNKKTGGQEGHAGVTLNKMEIPDEVVDIPLESDVCECGRSLLKILDETKTRQVFDFIVKLFVTEYVVHTKKCLCGKIHSSEFPKGVTQPVEYGHSAKALMSLLTQYHFVPLERTCELIQDLFGIKPSEGTIVNTNSNLSDILETPVNMIKEQIKASSVVHFDESGFRDNTSLEWMHVASTKNLTYYEMHPKRGYDAAEAVGILTGFIGTAVHDHWKSYYKFTDCNHGECNSHTLRYLRSIFENDSQEWAETMAGLLLEIKESVQTHKDTGKTSMLKEECKNWLERYHSIIEQGYAEDEQKSPRIVSKKTGKCKNSGARQLLNRLQTYDIEHLAFMFDFDIPFDNNLSERDLRMQKLRQKISGCFRGENGAKVFCRTRSYISTARKNGIRAFDAIKQALEGNPFVPVNC